jgi:hypothetical protein
MVTSEITTPGVKKNMGLRSIRVLSRFPCATEVAKGCCLARYEGASAVKTGPERTCLMHNRLRLRVRRLY